LLSLVGGTFIGDLNNQQNCCNLDISNIPCLRCGTCCSKYQPRLSLPEAKTIADKLGLTWEDFLAQYADPRWPGTQSFLIRHHQDKCIFLLNSVDKTQNLCSIHAFKPACCRNWENDLNKAECQEGLKAKWELTVDSSGKIYGSKLKVKAFERFIQTLIIPS
jgi:Fe-S-cluster containining protein